MGAWGEARTTLPLSRNASDVSVHYRHRERHHDCYAERTHNRQRYNFVTVTHCTPPSFWFVGEPTPGGQLCSAGAPRTFLCRSGTICSADVVTVAAPRQVPGAAAFAVREVSHTGNSPYNPCPPLVDSSMKRCATRCSPRKFWYLDPQVWDFETKASGMSAIIAVVVIVGLFLLVRRRRSGPRRPRWCDRLNMIPLQFR